MANEKRRLIDANELMSDVYRGDEQQKNDIWHTSDIEYLLEAQPTVDAVPVVHGRWIDDGGLDEDGNGQYRCSSCGVGEKHNPTVTVSYCWNCGAKMRGDGNG